MLSASTVLKTLSESDYFQEKGKLNWPENFKPLLSERNFFNKFLIFNKLSIYNNYSNK